MPDVLALTPEARAHLQAFMTIVNLSIVDGSFTCHFSNGDARKLEVHTFHPLRLASQEDKAYSDGRIRP